VERLKRVLGQPDTVLFIGSGISRWSGLPSWTELIEELAAFVEDAGESAELIRSEARRGDLLQAASYGFDKLTKHQIGDFIRKACRQGTARPQEIHRKIVSLGPRCFITTNYDDLIEEGLRAWRPERFYPKAVTNRHLTEMADIVHARATDFVFKPHGDAADSESIILTREQYRQLLSDGERHAALESLKMLLASRPIVYFGFGLRDPDFLYVRDLLSNTYKGGTRDHYAVMADVTDDEVRYWRKNYGIHLLGYSTVERADKTRDHTALLRMLDGLIEADRADAIASVSDSLCSPETILALARHAARLARFPKQCPEFPIRVHSESDRNKWSQDVFNHSLVELFLDEGPPHAILLGLPGAGKSYSLQRAAARLADKLNEICLQERFDPAVITVPLFADLKLYRGNLSLLLNSMLPGGLSLDELTKQFKVKVLLDSFNEMPRELWESTSYEADFAGFLGRFPNVSIVIGSRTDDGLGKLGFPSYSLDQVDPEFVNSELQRLNVEIEGRFERELRRLLQKPFYFHLIATGAVKLSAGVRPKEVYGTFFQNLTDSFRHRFGIELDLSRALSLAAYEAINRGEEAQPLTDMLAILKTEVELSRSGESAHDIANWLVAQSVLIPYIGGRIAFFHQSATEYLAALQLVRRYVANASILKEKLRLKRWDQTLFLTLSLLPEGQSSPFLASLVETDFAFALNAAKYIEYDQEFIVEKLLSEVLVRCEPDDHRVEYAIKFNLPVSISHEPLLRKLMARGGSLAGAAVIRLAQLKGPAIKNELLEGLFENRNDYNYSANGIAPALSDLITLEDLPKFVTVADTLEEEVAQSGDQNACSGFITGAASLLALFEVSSVSSLFLTPEGTDIPIVRAKILSRMLVDEHSASALELAADLLIRGVDQAATSIYFISAYGTQKSSLPWAVFNAKHIDRLVAISKHLRWPGADSWSVRALFHICSQRPDLVVILRDRVLEYQGILKAALLYCVAPKDTAPVFEALIEVEKMEPTERAKQPFELLRQIELSWVGNEELFLRLLRIRDTALALTLIERVISPDFTIGELEIKEIDWTLEWLSDENDPDAAFWLRDRFGRLLGRFLNPESRQLYINEMNKPDSTFRNVLARHVLIHFGDLTTDAFTEDAISFLLADLRDRDNESSDPPLLGVTATEAFVTDRLLPLIDEAKPRLLENLREVLREAGNRHGRRYIST